MLKIATGSHLFDHHVTDYDLHRLQSHVRSHVLPMPSDAQRAESEINDASSRKEAGRSNIETAHLSNARYQLTSDISKPTTTDAEHMNRKKKSEKEESNYLLGHNFSRSMLTHCDPYFATPCSKAESSCYRMMLSKNLSCMRIQADDDCVKLITFNSKRR